MVARAHYDEITYRQVLSDQLPAGEQQQVTAHIEGCGICQTKLESLSETSITWDDVRRFLQHNGYQAAAAVESSTASISRLSFLTASDRPGSLGRFGRYEIEDILGSGGMGVVLRGFDPALNRHSAIKVLAPELATSAAARQRFSREAKSAAAVVHDHVVPIQTVDEEQGLPYLVMPVVEGQSVEQRVEKQGALEIKEVLRIGSQIASGLAAAHAQGLVHRDVKPANVLLENGVERVMITDFGLARAADDANMTRSGVIAGTPQYMSPEQVRGSDVDHRSDLFSLGSVLYFLCSGRSPFRAETTMGVLNRIVNDEPRSLRAANADVPVWLQNIIERLLAKNPDERFQSATEVEAVLGQWLAHVQRPENVQQPPFPQPPNRQSGKRRSSRLPQIALGLAGLLLAGVLITLELNKGTLTIESFRDDVPIRIMNGDEVYDRMTVSREAKSIRIAAGEYQVVIDADGDGIRVDNGTVMLKRRGAWIARVVENSVVDRVTEEKTGNKKKRRVSETPNFRPQLVIIDGRSLTFEIDAGRMRLRDYPTGEQLWERDAPDGVKEYRIGDEDIVISSNDGLTVFDTKSGDIKKSIDPGKPYLRPVPITLDGRRLTFEVVSGRMHARDAETDEQLWVRDAPPGLKGFQTGRGIIEIFTNDGLTIIDAMTGATKNSIKSGESYFRPIPLTVDGRRCTLEVDGERIYLRDTDKGVLLWVRDAPKGLRGYQTSNRAIEIMTNDGVTVLDPATGAVKWKSERK